MGEKERLFKEESEKLQERQNQLLRDIDHLKSELSTSMALKEKEENNVKVLKAELFVKEGDLKSIKECMDQTKNRCESLANELEGQRLEKEKDLKSFRSSITK